MNLIQRVLVAFAWMSLLLVSFAVGCGPRVRYYDPYHSDYHRWNRAEDREYRRYLNERHKEYRDFHDLDDNDRRDYWNWRHEHHDGDEHRDHH